MCSPATCGTCHKATYQGCGMHVDQVLAGVPNSERCQCTAQPQPSFTGWSLFGRRR